MAIFLDIVDWCDYTTNSKRSHLKCILWYEQNERKRLVKPRASLEFSNVLDLVAQKVLKKAFIETLNQDQSAFSFQPQRALTCSN